jgi:hypothetical protein
MFMSRHQNAGKNHKVNIPRSFENVAKTKYLRTTVKYQNLIHEEIKSRLNMGSARNHSDLNRLSSSLLKKNLKIKIYKTVTLPVLLYGCQTWPLTLKEDHRLRMFENRVLWIMKL